MKMIGILLAMLALSVAPAIAMHDSKSCPAAPAVAAHVLRMHGLEGIQQGPYIAMVAQDQEMFGDRCGTHFHHDVHHYLHTLGAVTAPE